MFEEKVETAVTTVPLSKSNQQLITIRNTKNRKFSSENRPLDIL